MFLVEKSKAKELPPPKAGGKKIKEKLKFKA